MKIQWGNSVAVHRAILRTAGLRVPRQEREEWFAEWRSELWYAWQSRIRESQMVHRPVDVTAFCLSAFNDALWLRRNPPRRKVRHILGLSPWVRQTVKALLTVRWNCIVPRKPFLARWAPDGEAAVGSAGAHPAKE
jgi:heme A synthase